MTVSSHHGLAARLAAAAMLCLCAAGCGIIGATDPTTSLANVAVTDVNLAAVPDGTYQGEYSLALAPDQYAANHHFRVKVTVSSGAYAAIAIEEPASVASDPGYLAFLDRVVAANSLRVDAISGASISSRALQRAIEAAVAK